MIDYNIYDNITNQLNKNFIRKFYWLFDYNEGP